MRVPIPIAIILGLLATVVAWIISTRDKDFTSPPTPEDLIEITNEWQESKPHIPPPQPANSKLLDNSNDTTTRASSTPIPVKLEKLPTTNLDHSPALSEYGTLGDKGAVIMIRLATHLETNGHYQRALLAWERVIDTSNPTEGERQQAISAIKRIKKSLPPWNPDPANDIPLTLHAGATLSDKEALERALTSAADLISEASGNVIQVDTKASIGKSSSLRTPRIPIAIWFSRPGKSADDARAETPPISFMADLNQKHMLASQITAGVYSLLRAHLVTETNFSPLPELPTNANPDDLLKYHVTRLMWREFVNSLKE